MQNNSPTAAGHSKPAPDAQKLALVDALNQVFTLFRLNYHNQYLKAFGNTTELNEVKRLWLEMLGRFDARTLLTAAKSVIETSDYLPTLHTMIHHCERASSRGSPPDVHSAYLEACRAPSPKAAFKWSHPLVYHAGKQCDWLFLQSSPEVVAYPIFKRHYAALCDDWRTGQEFAPPHPPEIEDQSQTPLDKTANRAKLAAFRDILDI